MEMKKNGNFLRITLVRSTIGKIPRQRRTIQALGLRKINSSVEKTLNPAIEGMLRSVAHLVKTEEL